MRRYSVVFLVLIFLTAVSCLLLIPTCNGESESYELDLTMYIDVTQVNLENHTVVADVVLRIDGIPPTTIGGVPRVPDNISVNFENINFDEVNCTMRHNLGNETYSFQGEVKGKQWYLYSLGEAYPYDLNRAEFSLYPYNLVFPIDDTIYGPEPEWNYTFKVVNEQVRFSGLLSEDLENTWAITTFHNEGILNVYFIRDQVAPILTILAPIFWIFTVMILAPTLSNDRETKIRFYSSILVFSPMFLFAIQSFIPPRNTVSIPEFAVILLMLLSATLFLVNLPKQKNEKWAVFLEGVAFLSVISFLIIMAPIVFSRLLSWWLPLQVMVVILGVLLFAGIIIKSIVFYFTKKKQDKIEEAKAKAEAKAKDEAYEVFDY